MKKDLISISDFSAQGICALLGITQRLKMERSYSNYKPLSGKTLAMIFQKPSTRTTVSFAAGMVQLGGTPLILNSQDLQLKRGESLSDTAKTLSLYVDAIMVRANKHEDVEEMSRHSKVPVINGLTDKEHPCQVLGDLYTIFEKKNLRKIEDLKKIKITYLGDGNNIAHSLLLASAILGMEIVISSPKNYEPEKAYREKANSLVKSSGAQISFVPDPLSAVTGSDIIYTDVWASMGKDEEREHRKKIFLPYQVNAPLLAFAKPDVSIMHCLPAHRGEEITDEVMDSPKSIIFEQAENRLHIQKAILLHLMT